MSVDFFDVIDNHNLDLIETFSFTEIEYVSENYNNFVSLPSSVGPIHSDWTGVGVLSPQSSNVFISQGDMPRSAKLILETNWHPMKYLWFRKTSLEEWSSDEENVTNKRFKGCLEEVKCTPGFPATFGQFGGLGFRTGELWGWIRGSPAGPACPGLSTPPAEPAR